MRYRPRSLAQLARARSSPAGAPLARWQEERISLFQLPALLPWGAKDTQGMTELDKEIANAAPSTLPGGGWLNGLDVRAPQLFCKVRVQDRGVMSTSSFVIRAPLHGFVRRTG